MVSTRPNTVDDLYRLGPDAPYELIEGDLIAVSPQGRIHGRVLSNLTLLLGRYIREHDLGELLVGDVGFILDRDPDTVLGPDLAFVTAGRLPEAEDGYLDLAPDLAIEVVSPGNSPGEIARNVQLYLEAGSSEVWVVRPRAQEIALHRPATAVAIARSGDRLESQMFPNLSIPVSEIFARHR